MADEERDAESSPAPETNVSADPVDTDSVSRGDDSDDESTGDESSVDESTGDEPAADDTQTDVTEPVYGRVTPPEESVLDESPGDTDSDAVEPDATSDDTDADFEDEDDTLVVGDPDPAVDFEDEDAVSETDEGAVSETEEDESAGDDLDESDSPEVLDEPTVPDDDDLEDGGLASNAPESDQEMPLTDHIEEMIRRLAVVLGVAGVVTLILFPGADILNAYVNTGLPSATDVINFLWNTHIPAADAIEDRRPRLYGPLELILTKLKVAGLAGTVIGLPVFVYQTYLFMRPGLYPKERKYYLAAVPTSLILALVGVTFAHFVVLPAIFAYFTSYTEGTAVIAFGLKETFNLILILMGYMAIVFQIPLFVELAIMMKLVTRQWLEDRRLLFWGAFLGLAFLVSPDPTGMAPIIIGATMIVLFEGTLAVLRWTGN
ncbi:MULTISPECIES: twin-arginine translocase subunit TatC [Haloferax]|uniref:Sec-independent protein translocase protein TatC n=2 Tax=Haloferax TaxID=2251 RepID=A0A6G1YYX7_9EURY|nr:MULTISPECIES: twin-arginine translocase subunit TatC [Haloferax]KAB1186977.1 MFS transporter [Haloferax sp. CBA1149]MRW79607.1 MFS transporter [Haloferax marinisediminis]